MIRIIPKRHTDAFILEDAAYCFSYWLLGYHLASRLTLKIRICDVVLGYKKPHMGDCESISKVDELQRKFLIRLEKSAGLACQMDTLAHEIVHVAQLARKRMWMLHHPEDPDITITRFDGKEYAIRGDIDEKDYPWEIEACAVGGTLFDHYLAYMEACADKGVLLGPLAFPWSGSKM